MVKGDQKILSKQNGYPAYLPPVCSEMATLFTFPLCVATLNIRGLRNVKRQRQLNHVLRQQDVDVVAVQEMKISSARDVSSALETFPDLYSSHARGASAR